MAIRIIGRSQLPGRSGKINPEVRFRQTQFHERISAQKAAKKKINLSQRPIFGPLTGIGILVLVGGVFLVLGSLWAFVFSSTFLVKAVEVEGTTSLSREQVARAFYEIQSKKVLLVVPGNHIIFLNKNKMLKTLNSLYPYVGDVENFKRRWPASVSFAITEKQPMFLWIETDSRKFLLDGEGTILSQAEDSLYNLPVLEGSIASEAKIGDSVAESEIAKFALKVQEAWPSEWAFRPNNYRTILVPGGAEFLISTNEGWTIKAVTDIKPEIFMKNLEAIFKSEIKESSLRKNLSYIDLRLPNRAFYCLHGNPCAAK